MSDSPIIGRYEIVEELGRGAMGSVYKARDPAVGRTVALKTILSSALTGPQAAEYRERFYREARAASSLAHPGIVPVFDMGEHGGLPYLVMEFVEGSTLADAVKKGERFTLDRVCEIGQQLADALGYAHRQGVIHRDIKPANILMTSREVYGSERPRIADFGIAKFMASEMTSTGQLLGTPTFMPPEQFTGAPVDGRADLFSLGVILYALATGEQPFHGETMTAVSYKVVHTDPIPPSKLNPSVPPQLEAAILKCLAKNPAERYQTGEEIARDLEAIRANTGATATRASPATVLTIGDSDPTLVAIPSAFSLNAAKATVLPPRPPAPKSSKAGATPARPTAMIAAVAAGAVLIFAVAGWILFRPHRQPALAPPQAPATAPAPAAPQPAGLPKPAPTPAVEPRAAGLPKPAPTPAADIAAAPVPAAALTVSQPHPPPPAFNPRSLDPRTNARLRIVLSHVPGGLPFTVEMNQRTYLRGVTGDKSDLEHLYVPPGVQQFRVAISSGGRDRISNIVSDEFKARKRKTLKIEFLAHGKAAAVVHGAISRDAQVFLSLN
ncbi:MAG: serine/threonine-protein kinase [Terracidiphilus sp.]